ncbi:unnamed protein product [Rotaria magnacalcarata]|uniref:Peptidase metallopeptidase domain-containing protein n=1 Tax=Rotaria magnacalcarata TaxID=392030 RepID=A0A816K4C9_9BILA|nr:unnamed protein product [Rotaria magnacalcarata]CAF1919722.1 unnamed protein product [Rotaria magnacalcarata]CAF4196994.1 unnamed protein product [Rotaria magnacalcarata]CAF4430027.1 unnamed protein product [Rotaria magnacalcarata]
MKQIHNIVLLVFIIFIDVSLAAKKSRKDPVVSEEDAVAWLNKFGYNPCLNSAVQCSLSFPSLMEEYQKRYRLKVTGKLDDATKKQMNRPRCGIADKPVALNAAAITTSKWTHSSLTYSLRGFPTQLSQTQTTNIIREAFQAWTDHVPLRIEPVCSTCSANFTINFFREEHSDAYAFDGSGGTLAHAFFPEDGRVHFDKDEAWTESFNDDRINLYLVAVHEIGHALGLDHTYNQDSIMFPSYQLMAKSNIIPRPDRDAIQGVYGKKQSSSGTTTTRSTTTSTRSTTTTTTTRRVTTTTTTRKRSPTIDTDTTHPRCRMTLDAALDHPDGTLYTFNAGIIWRYLPNEGTWDSRTTSYEQHYPKLPRQITGAVHNRRKDEFIFFTNKAVFNYGTDSKSRAVYRNEQSLARNLYNSIVGAIYYHDEVHVVTSKAIRVFRVDNGYQLANQRELHDEFPGFTGTVTKAFTYGNLHHFFTTDRLVYVWSERLNSWQTFKKPMETNWFACLAAKAKTSSSSQEDESVPRHNYRNSARHRQSRHRNHHHNQYN